MLNGFYACYFINLKLFLSYFFLFKPNLRRLMQVRNQHLPIASKYDHLFSPSRKSNRLELISDFPTENNAEVISSLQIHPQNWVALSRNNSYDDSSEWLCVHDIQKIESDDEDLETASSFSQQDNVIGNINENEHSVGINLRPPSYHLESENNAESVNTDEIQLIPSAPALPPPSGDTEILDLWAGNVPWNRSRRQLLDRPSRINSGILTMNHLKNNQKPVAIQQNRERLIFYTEELNVGKGFIKELCFSSDGR
jgi:DDB1- and CUL4-associated factor 10